MKKTLEKIWKLPPLWLRILIISVLILGVFFRFANLDGKIYWHDETLTSLRISGYHSKELIQKVFDNQIYSVGELLKYQTVNSSERGVGYTVKALAIESQYHPPLFYVAAHFWAHIFGSSIAAVRSLSAVLSLLAFPGIYWLCLELFSSSLTGWIGVALVAVSPFHIHYAQEARQYSLLTVAVLFTGAALLRAIRVKTNLSWIIYAATVAIGLYTNPLFALVTVTLGCYIFINDNFRFTKAFISYIIASAIGFLTFVPWLLMIINNISHLQNISSWMKTRLPLKDFIDRWIQNLNYIFFQPNFRLPSGSALVITIAILLLIGYSLYFICRRTPKRIWLFVWLLTLLPSITLIVPDLVNGGMRSTIPRYIIPSYVGIQVATAFLFATKITSISSKVIQQRLWRFLLIVLMSLSLLSNVAYLRAGILRKEGYNPTLDMARLINQSSAPLVVFLSSKETTVGDILTLSHYLDSQVKLQLRNKATLPEIPTGFEDIFVFKPIETFKQTLQQKYKLKPVYKTSLWRLEK